ncbi:MAG: L,D-transpeptidase/peptidoglycan binding protein [Clostridium sp.]|nr:L,D-transpeptidase/peptidoglycan binding protein [Clostridium sp.]MCM1398720.1 L,D-transpeptidase/peptidoglycan binding protein [Clostridium sp.]MCM1458648.1 L,D-transpeptidase/peptidoglycan binding protein [Bacteroides sp.]
MKEKKKKSQDKTTNKNKLNRGDTQKDKVADSGKTADKEHTDETAATMEATVPFVDPAVAVYKKKKKVTRIVTISVVSALIIVYLAGFFISSMFFYENTIINGVDVSGKKLADAEALLKKEMNEYTLQLDFSNGTQTIKVGDGGLSLSLSETIQDIKQRQKPYLWFMHFGSKYVYDVKYKAYYDEKKLSELVMSYDQLQTQNMEKSTDAVVDISSGTAVIVPDETGTELDTEQVLSTVKGALNDGVPSVNIAEAGCYIEAKVQEDSEEILKGYQEAEDFLSIDAVYDFKGYKVSIPKEELAGMAYIDSRGELKISKDKVNAYAAKFAKQYTTSDTERKFKTHDGEIIGIYGQYYGWVIDEEKEAEELYELICKKKSFIKEPACERTGYAMGEMNDIGGTYIEIDLTNQHLYYYVGGKLVLDNDIVSGWLNNPNHYKTPGGLFAMDNKAYKVILRGENYATPVTYWMGFNGGIGIHDATWRSEFGGTIYVNNGSHGCINLPISFAAQVYEIADPGMPVLCYWLDEVPHY